MTAITTPLSQPTNTRAFRRGLLTGIAASVVLAASMMTVAVSSGVVHIGEPAAVVPAALPAPTVADHPQHGTFVDQPQRALLAPTVADHPQHGTFVDAPPTALPHPAPRSNADGSCVFDRWGPPKPC